MERPKYKHIRMKGKDTTYLLNHILAYRLELEKYCDELEKELSETFNQHLEDLIDIKDKEIAELEKALDKACKQLEISIVTITTTGRVWSCEEWKEWLLKDE